MSRTSRGRPGGRYALAALAPLALVDHPAVAETLTGTLAVTVEVVESCRVTAASGLGSELVPCTGSGPRTAPAAVAAAASGGSARRPAARAVVERSAAGRVYLTTIF